MKVAGFGFKRDVEAASLRQALDAVGGPNGLNALATISEKAMATALVSLAGELGLPIMAVPASHLEGIETTTQSMLVDAKFGVGSVAEAVALIAAGRNAALLCPRVISRDRRATVAIAEGDGL